MVFELAMLQRKMREKGDQVFNARLARDVFEVYGITVAVGSRQ